MDDFSPTSRQGYSACTVSEWGSDSQIIGKLSPLSSYSLNTMITSGCTAASASGVLSFDLSLLSGSSAYNNGEKLGTIAFSSDLSSAAAFSSRIRVKESGVESSLWVSDTSILFLPVSGMWATARLSVTVGSALGTTSGVDSTVSWKSGLDL